MNYRRARVEELTKRLDQKHVCVVAWARSRYLRRVVPRVWARAIHQDLGCNMCPKHCHTYLNLLLRLLGRSAKERLTTMADDC
jgi:hypothetical protein